MTLEACWHSYAVEAVEQKRSEAGSRWRRTEARWKQDFGAQAPGSFECLAPKNKIKLYFFVLNNAALPENINL